MSFLGLFKTLVFQITFHLWSKDNEQSGI